MDGLTPDHTTVAARRITDGRRLGPQAAEYGYSEFICREGAEEGVEQPRTVV